MPAAASLSQVLGVDHLEPPMSLTTVARSQCDTLQRKGCGRSDASHDPLGSSLLPVVKCQDIRIVRIIPLVRCWNQHKS